VTLTIDLHFPASDFQEVCLCSFQARYSEAIVLTGLLQLAVFFFRAIKYWSGFAGDFCSATSKCSAKDLLCINFCV
jgi:hypothetical protein